MKITDINQLEAGKTYTKISHQFNDAVNRITVICNDVLDLKRPLVYCYFTDRVPCPISKGMLLYQFNKNHYNPNVFVIWDFELDNNMTILETNINHG